LGGHVHGGRPAHVRWNGNNNCLGVTLPHSESKVIVSICTSETNTITIKLGSAEPCSQTRELAPFGPGYEWLGHGRPARPARYTLANAPSLNPDQNRGGHSACTTAGVQFLASPHRKGEEGGKGHRLLLLRPPISTKIYFPTTHRHSSLGMKPPLLPAVFKRFPQFIRSPHCWCCWDS
jgi:hypothetical protein